MRWQADGLAFAYMSGLAGQKLKDWSCRREKLIIIPVISPVVSSLLQSKETKRMMKKGLVN